MAGGEGGSEPAAVVVVVEVEVEVVRGQVKRRG